MGRHDIPPLPDNITVPHGSQSIEFKVKGSSSATTKIKSFNLEGTYSPNPFSATTNEPAADTLTITDNNENTSGGDLSYSYSLTLVVNGREEKSPIKQITNESGPQLPIP